MRAVARIVAVGVKSMRQIMRDILDLVGQDLENTQE